MEDEKKLTVSLVNNKVPVIQKTATKEVVPKLRSAAAKRQWIIVLLANLSVISSGMALGFPAVSLPELTSPTSETKLDAGQASWFASINAITCPLGGLLAGYILDKIGRKLTMVLINVLSIVAWTLQAYADKSDPQKMYYHLLVARLIIGMYRCFSTPPDVGNINNG